MTTETEPTPPEIILTDPAYWAENIDALREALAATSGDTVEPPIETPTPRSNVSVGLRVPARWLDEPEGLVEALNIASMEERVGRERVSAVPLEERLTLTVEEAARLLGISRSFAYEAVAAGELPSIRIGRRVLIPRAALERLLDPSPHNDGGPPPSR